MPIESPHPAWHKIGSFLKAGTLIPAFRLGAITFGNDAIPLYPWPTTQVAGQLRQPGNTCSPAFVLGRPPTGLPELAGVGALLGNLFGRFSANPRFHLADSDAIVGHPHAAQ